MSTELYWPDDLCPVATDLSVLDMVGRFPSALNGVTSTVGRPGSRLKMSMSFRNLQGRNRLLLQRIIAATRGGTHPIRCRDHSYTQQGSFPGTELLTNNTFDDGTTGWTAGSEYTLSVSDRTLRAQRNAVTAAANLITRSSITVTPYVPYVARAIVVPGQGAYASGFTAFLASQVSPVATVFGMTQNVYVPVASSAEFRLRDNQSSGPVAGDHVYVPWVSLAQCAQVDNGSNLLRHTEEMAENPSFWPNTATSWGDDATAAPNGSTVGESLIEDSATSMHYTQGIATCDAALENYCFAVALKAGGRGFARVLLLSTPANTSISCYINLSTGAITNESTGANWLNLRSYSANLGNGWWYVAIVGRKNSSDTSLRARIQVASAAGTDNYAGNGTGNIYVWRPTVAQSSVPVRLTNNGATADPDGTLQNLGGGIYTKGWPASSSGLLLPGDQVEIGGQLQIVTGPVNSDAAGLAFLPLASLRVAPEDDSPVVVVGPLGRWIPEESENGWTNTPGIFSDSELVLVESG
jgi:hypothetical protein